MHIQLRLFAGLRETLGISSELLDLPDDVRSAGEVLDILRLRGEAWREALATGAAFRIAVDQRMGERSSPVHHGSELALFPPVTGG